jgi:hypothetical protein
MRYEIFETDAWDFTLKAPGEKADADEHLRTGNNRPATSLKR